MSNQVLFEIGTEEIPARFIEQTEEQLKNMVEKWLQDVRISYTKTTSYSTPRRFTILIDEIDEEQSTVIEEVRGPQINIAKDDAGNWTKAAIGFTKAQGKSLSDIYTKMNKGNEYIFVEKTHEGKATKSILPEFKKIIDSLQFPQTMTWGSQSYKFARPIRWLVALFNDEVIPFEIAGVHTGNKTYGHRFLGDAVTISSPTEYEAIMENQYVIANPIKREQLIVDGIKELEEKAGFHIVVDEPLLKEVRNLVEYPTVFYGTFSKGYLDLPEEVLMTSMKEHQRYFPVLNETQTELLPYFVSVRNGDEHYIKNVIHGNEKVLTARLADAAFFYAEDKKQSISFFNDKLKTVIFQEDIGTIYEKVNRIQQICETILTHLNVEKLNKERTLRAAEICKFDLMTNMVNEFTDLQGIMGEKYAQYFGEEKQVASAIREHYLPLHSKGELPKTIEGAIVSVADKLDTIIGCFSVGLIPSSSQDPYGLRRQATGILRIMQDRKWEIILEDLLLVVGQQYKLSEEMKGKLKQFFLDRASYLLKEKNISHDIIQAVFSRKFGVIHYNIEKTKLLADKRNDPTFKVTEEALVRIMNVSKENMDDQLIDATLFQTESENNLYKCFKNVRKAFMEADKQYNAEVALQELGKLAVPIHHFFEHNMVMAEDETIKDNRISLVSHISSLIRSFADLTLIEWKQHH